MASFLVRLGDLANALEVEGAELQDLPEYSGVNRFTDVEADSAHVEAINRLADMEVTTGTTPVTFDPSAPVSRGQMTTFIRSEEHTSELQSLMRISYAVFCLKKKKRIQQTLYTSNTNSTIIT